MKRFYKYMIMGAAALGMASCNDSFLDRTPTNDLNDEAFWNTTEDLEAYCNGIYNEAGNNSSYMFMIGYNSDPWSVKLAGPYTMEAMSDNFATMDSNQSWAATLAAGRETVGNGGTNYCAWNWTLLRRINVFLANYEKVQADETAKQPYLGEALFFRAWFYFYMVQNYGDVPLITTPLNTDSPELYGERTSRADVMKQVLTDINDASTYLPADNWGENRVTKGAALALKSRICLYEGTYRKYHPELNLTDGDSFLQECVNAYNEIKDLGYSIHDTGNVNEDYTALFTTDDLSTLSDEVIFYRRYENGMLMHRMCGYTVNLRNGGTKDFVDDFLYVDKASNQALPIAVAPGYNNDTPEQEFANRDPRLTQTFLAPGNDAAKELFEDANLGKFTYPRLGNMTNWPSLTGYHTIKYYIREQDKKGFGNETQDYPIFRYAEVLLNYAEAMAELGKCDQTVLDETVNKLRNRVDMPHLTTTPVADPKYAKYGLDNLIIEIRRERRVELSFEFLRYQDLMRWAWGDKLKDRVLGMRLEDADFNDPRYDGNITKAGSSNEGENPIYVFVAEDGKQYVDAYGGTNYAADKRSFDPNKDYLRPIPLDAISANTNLKQNPNWQ